MECESRGWHVLQSHSVPFYEWNYVHVHHYLPAPLSGRQLMFSCEQAEPPPLSLVIDADPPTLSCDKADPHYPQCVLIYVRHGRGGGRVRGLGELIIALEDIYSIKQSGPYGGFHLCLSQK